MNTANPTVAIGIALVMAIPIYLAFSLQTGSARNALLGGLVAFIVGAVTLRLIEISV